jgi:WD40 repeat protein
VTLSSDGRRAVSGSWDKTLRVWDLGSGQSLQTLQGHTSGVTAVALSSDGRRAVSGSPDHTVRVWDLQDGKEVVAFTIDGYVKACAMPQDNRTIVAGDGFGRVHFLRLEGMD